MLSHDLSLINGITIENKQGLTKVKLGRYTVRIGVYLTKYDYQVVALAIYLNENTRIMLNPEQFSVSGKRGRSDGGIVYFRVSKTLPSFVLEYKKGGL